VSFSRRGLGRRRSMESNVIGAIDRRGMNVNVDIGNLKKVVPSVAKMLASASCSAPSRSHSATEVLKSSFSVAILGPCSAQPRTSTSQVTACFERSGKATHLHPLVRPREQLP